jgi:hypothetical protein
MLRPIRGFLVRGHKRLTEDSNGWFRQHLNLARTGHLYLAPMAELRIMYIMTNADADGRERLGSQFLGAKVCTELHGICGRHPVAHRESRRASGGDACELHRRWNHANAPCYLSRRTNRGSSALPARRAARHAHRPHAATQRRSALPIDPSVSTRGQRASRSHRAGTRCHRRTFARRNRS